jgi:hypothetical protein
MESSSSSSNWVVTSPYPGVYEITCLNEAVEFELNRLTAPMSWDRAVEAVREYERAYALEIRAWAKSSASMRQWSLDSIG